MTHFILPQMVKRFKANFLNVGSIAGKEFCPKGNIYCVTNYAVVTLTEARKDLSETGIKDIYINPGIVETELFEVRFQSDKNKVKHVYNGIKALQASDKADTIFFIANLTFLPTAQTSGIVIHQDYSFN